MLILLPLLILILRNFPSGMLQKLVLLGDRKRERGFLQFIYGRPGQLDKMGRSVHHIDFRLRYCNPFI